VTADETATMATDKTRTAQKSALLLTRLICLMTQEGGAAAHARVKMHQNGVLIF
jgi:hypothetical protein